MTFGFACVSHDPPLPSPQWGYRPERLHALLEVRQNLVGLDKVPSVTLDEDARWLLWHPNCEVALIDETGQPVDLAEAVARADADVEEEPEPPAPTPEEEAPAEPSEASADPEPAPEAAAEVEATAEVRSMRRPRSMPEPDEVVDGRPIWRCSECQDPVDEQDAILAWARRRILCRPHNAARKVV